MPGELEKRSHGWKAVRDAERWGSGRIQTKQLTEEEIARGGGLSERWWVVGTRGNADSQEGNIHTDGGGVKTGKLRSWRGTSQICVKNQRIPT